MYTTFDSSMMVPVKMFRAEYTANKKQTATMGENSFACSRKTRRARENGRVSLDMCGVERENRRVGSCRPAARNGS